jgi:hypothetical protein
VAKSELVDEIRDAFLAANDPEISVGAVDLDDFCAFMTNWLAEQGVVGVGHAATGLALRLANGREIGLLSADIEMPTANTPAVALTRGGASARQGIGGGDTSTRITGNK